MSDSTKEAIKKAITNIVEAFDQFVPVIGPILDTQVVDTIENTIICKMVDVVWDASFKISTDDDICIWSA
jgi:hypothetical protein